jgi:hypothetical protein
MNAPAVPSHVSQAAAPRHALKLGAMTKAWGTPGNKDSKQRLKDAVATLCSEVP